MRRAAPLCPLVAIALASAGCHCPPPGSADGCAGSVGLFDGETLDGWGRCNYAGAGEIEVRGDGVLRIGRGEVLSGLRYTRPTPVLNYEVVMEARRVEGGDFFYCLTFPYREANASFVLGGWGGSVCGISSIDYMDAMENMTMSVRDFEGGRWYEVRLVVSDHRIQGFVDGERVVNINVENREVGMRFGEIEESVPFGLSTYRTTGEYRNLKLRELTTEEIAAAAKLDEEDRF